MNIVLLPLGITLLSNEQFVKEFSAYGFTTTWDYTTLKRPRAGVKKPGGFTTTWDYTTLKPEGGVRAWN